MALGKDKIWFKSSSSKLNLFFIYSHQTSKEVSSLKRLKDMKKDGFLLKPISKEETTLFGQYNL